MELDDMWWECYHFSKGIIMVIAGENAQETGEVTWGSVEAAVADILEEAELPKDLDMLDELVESGVVTGDYMVRELPESNREEVLSALDEIAVAARQELGDLPAEGLVMLVHERSGVFGLRVFDFRGYEDGRVIVSQSRKRSVSGYRAPQEGARETKLLLEPRDNLWVVIKG